MPAEKDLTKQEESIQDQPALPDLEIEAGELEQEDADRVAGGGPMHAPMAG
jgi:hypothetical protein